MSSELERAAQKLLDNLWQKEPGGFDIAESEDVEDLRSALASETAWETVLSGASEVESNYEHRWQRRRLVDYSHDQALHPHEGDEEHCMLCGEHRSWHDDA